MLKRILTSAIGLVVFFAALFANAAVFEAFACILIVIALYEIHHALNAHKLLWVAAAVTTVIFIASMSMPFMGLHMALVAAVLIYLAVLVVLHGKVRYSEVLSSFALTVYIVLAFSALAFVRVSFGRTRVLMIFVIAWITDTAAYFGGTLFGKHKLAPVLSPKKTVEGAVSGVIGAVISGIVYVVLYGVITGRNFGISPAVGAVICLAGSVLSQLGDLAASAIKRDTGVKDFGNLLPGHGGIMDRFDSVMYITPVIYYFFTFVLR